ncbi:MAG: response regulator, partial [Desulfobacterales bacterium]
VPIIALTFLGRPQDSDAWEGTVVAGHLTRPVKQKDLHRAIIAAVNPSVEQDAPAPVHTAEPKVDTKGKRAHILLVEDYPTNQQVALMHLTRAGHQVDLVENGREAVDAYKRKDFDLILMDIQMPIMDGYEATTAIRAWEKSSGEENAACRSPSVPTPIIAMTAHAMEGYRDTCLKAGMDDYIAKPLRRKRLLELVDTWIEKIADAQPTVINTTAKDDAPMDFEKAIAEFDGDEAFLVGVLGDFIDNVAPQISNIRQYIADGDAGAVRMDAHAIRGSAANLTADGLSAIARELEEIGKSGVLAKGAEVLKRLEAEFSRLETYARSR